MERGHVLRKEEFQATGGGCRTGGGQMAAQAGLNETFKTSTCQHISSLDSSLSGLALSSLEWLQPAEPFQRKVSGVCREKRRKSLETVSTGWK